jgi:hypothetical protein
LTALFDDVKAVSVRKNLGGRPKREPDPGERVKLGLRVTAEVKRKLDAAADANGRSQSQEAEFRLEQSFERDRLSGGISQLQATLDTIARFLELESDVRRAESKKRALESEKRALESEKRALEARAARRQKSDLSQVDAAIAYQAARNARITRRKVQKE